MMPVQPAAIWTGTIGRSSGRITVVNSGWCARRASRGSHRRARRHLAVRFAEREAAVWGQPFATMTLGIEASLHVVTLKCPHRKIGKSDGLRMARAKKMGALIEVHHALAERPDGYVCFVASCTV
jgi:hypothetical protein